MKRFFKYRDRDDEVQVDTPCNPRTGRYIWVATSESGARALCPFPGFLTEAEAMADAVSLLNVVGE